MRNNLFVVLSLVTTAVLSDQMDCNTGKKWLRQSDENMYRPRDVPGTEAPSMKQLYQKDDREHYRPGVFESGTEADECFSGDSPSMRPHYYQSDDGYRPRSTVTPPSPIGTSKSSPPGSRSYPPAESQYWGDSGAASSMEQSQQWMRDGYMPYSSDVSQDYNDEPAPYIPGYGVMPYSFGDPQ